MNRVAVEQAIAYGGIDYAVETLGVGRDLAEKVLAWMADPTGKPPLGDPAADPIPCGTMAAFYRHKRAGEPVDDLCRTAIRAYNRALVQRRKGAES